MQDQSNRSQSNRSQSNRSQSNRSQSSRPGGPSSDAVAVAARLLIPTTNGPAIVRSGLVDRVLGATAAPLTMVTAPAGWGKTTLAAQIANKTAAAGRAVAWLSVEEQDNLHSLTTDLLAGLRVAHPMLDLDLREVDVPPVARDLPAVFDKIAAALDTLVDDVTLVLDDAHLLTDEAALIALARLVNRRPVHLRVVMTGRAEPSLPVNRWRMNGLLDDIGRDDLAADADQARTLLTALGLRLREIDVDRLLSVTEGWIGGIRLAARGLLTAPDPQVALDRLVQSRGLRGGLADYLIEQVVNDLPAPTRTFLRDVSIVNPIPVALAECLTGRGDARMLLSEVSESTGFVSADDPADGKFRMHHSLGAALRHQLDQVSPQRRQALHREASRWFAEQERTLPAVRQAILGQDWEAAGTLLLTGLPRLSLNGAVPQIRRLLSEIPRPVVLDDPALAVIEFGSRAWLGEYGDLDRLEAAVESGIDELATTRPELADWSRFVLIMSQTGFARVSGRYQEAVDLIGSERATRLAGPPESADGARWHALAQSNLGTAALWSGHPTMARGALTAATRSAQRFGFSLPALNSMSLLAWLDVRDGRLADAASHAVEAINAADRRGWNTVYQAAPAHLCLAAVALERVDPVLVAVELDRASAANRGWNELAITLLIGCVGARLQTAQGRPDEALVRLARLRTDPATRPTTNALDQLLIEAESEALSAAGRHDRAVSRLSTDADVDAGLLAVAGARQAIAEGEPRVAAALLSDPMRPVPLGRRRDVRIRHQLWFARANQLIGLHRRALSGLRAALDIAMDDGYRLPFRELGQHARPLLDLARSDSVGGRAALLTELIELTGELPDEPVGVNPGLTARERELLAYLPTRMTNDEIAHQLGISVNTIKSHARALYRKLDVPNRREAVRRAEQAGLI